MLPLSSYSRRHSSPVLHSLDHVCTFIFTASHSYCYINHPRPRPISRTLPNPRSSAVLFTCSFIYTHKLPYCSRIVCCFCMSVAFTLPLLHSSSYLSPIVFMHLLAHTYLPCKARKGQRKVPALCHLSHCLFLALHRSAMMPVSWLFLTESPDPVSS